LKADPDMSTPTALPARKTAANVLPRGVLLAIGAAVVAALVGTAAVRLSGSEIREPDAAEVARRALRFEDGPAGSVLAIDAASGQTAARFDGEQGFLRGALRALARERKRTGAGSEAPFELVLRSDNRLTLVDPVTQQRIDLESFGPTNAGVFARLLHREAPRQP
jgi:putative photosynthetic complex assembly protein